MSELSDFAVLQRDLAECDRLRWEAVDGLREEHRKAQEWHQQYRSAQERIAQLQRALLDLAQWAYCTHNPGRLGWEYHQAAKVLGVTEYQGPNRVERLEAEVARLREVLEKVSTQEPGEHRPEWASNDNEWASEECGSCREVIEIARAALAQDAPHS